MSLAIFWCEFGESFFFYLATLANSGLDLTSRQACTAEDMGEVEFLDVNIHCMPTEDDFGHVIKNLVNP